MTTRDVQNIMDSTTDVMCPCYIASATLNTGHMINFERGCKFKLDWSNEILYARPFNTKRIYHMPVSFITSMEVSK